MGNESSTFSRKGRGSRDAEKGKKKISSDMMEINNIKDAAGDVPMEQAMNNTPDTSNGGDGGSSSNNSSPQNRVVTMEQSAHTFAGPSSSRQNRQDFIMITDALADVRVK